MKLYLKLKIYNIKNINIYSEPKVGAQGGAQGSFEGLPGFS